MSMGTYWSLYECLMVLFLGIFVNISWNDLDNLFKRPIWLRYECYNQGGHHPWGGVEKLVIVHRKV